MTDTDLKALIAASEAATAQPWGYDPHVFEDTSIALLTHTSPDGVLGLADAHFITLAAELAAERERGERMRELIRVLVENDPDDAVSDGGHTVLDLWRHDARAALEGGA